MYRVIKFNSRYQEYLDYLENHINGVIEAWESIVRPAIEDYVQSNEDDFFDNLDLDKLSLQICNHDRSKYSEEEFIPYCNHYYPINGEDIKDEDDDIDYKYAWVHHKHNNPHHSQYWINVKDEGKIEALDMPLKYVCEMICDWASFKINNPDLETTKEWWNQYKDTFIMSDNTLNAVDRLLDICPNDF